MMIIKTWKRREQKKEYQWKVVILYCFFFCFFFRFLVYFLLFYSFGFLSVIFAFFYSLDVVIIIYIYIFLFTLFFYFIDLLQSTEEEEEYRPNVLDAREERLTETLNNPSINEVYNRYIHDMSNEGNYFFK